MQNRFSNAGQQGARFQGVGTSATPQYPVNIGHHQEAGPLHTQGNSRKGTQGNWAPNNAFAVEECGVAAELLTLPSLAVIRIFEYL